MRDIDFDELDKAVNSLMGSVDAPANGTKANDAAPNTMISKHRLSTPGRPPAVKPAPAVRRSGRFMDVVDSSSELNPLRQPVATPSRDTSPKPSQSAVFVPPAPTPTPAPEVSAKVPEVTATGGESIQVRRVTKDTIMPDPLELLRQMPASHEVEAVEDVATAAAPSAIPISVNISEALQEQLDAVEPKQAEQTASESVTDTVQPFILDKPKEQPPEAPVNDEPHTDDSVSLLNESPFVVDAKIEKRPLNANTATINTTEPLVSLDELMKHDQAFEQLEPASSSSVVDEPPVTPQIPELSSELVAIEATGKVTDDTTEEVATPLMASAEENNTSTKIEASDGPASIAQQYQSKESTGDTSHAPIYDASEYADPVAHPAKKKSGWLWVLSVLILLALGSGGAVALYLMGIIP